jgi:hypothetical protein
VPVMVLHRLKPLNENIRRLLNKWKAFNAQPMNQCGENISKLSLVWIFFNHSTCFHHLFLKSQIPPQGSTNLKDLGTRPAAWLTEDSQIICINVQNWATWHLGIVHPLLHVILLVSNLFLIHSFDF